MLDEFFFVVFLLFFGIVGVSLLFCVCFLVFDTVLFYASLAIIGCFVQFTPHGS